MKYCCTKFEEHADTTFEKPDHKGEYNGKWHVNGCCGGGCYVLQDIKFCPFCGMNLEARFIVQGTGVVDILPYKVFDTFNKKSVAFFEGHEDAQRHADHLQVDLCK